MEFDVFLSHNSKDKPAVRELARRLVKRNIRVWLDENQLIPGGNWQPLLEQGIAQSSTGAVLVGKDGLGPWKDEETQALLRQAASSGKRVIPVLLPHAPEQPELPYFLANRTWVDLRDGFTDQALDKLVWGITGTSAAASPVAPESRVSRSHWALALAGLTAALFIALIMIWTTTSPEQVLTWGRDREHKQNLEIAEHALPKDIVLKENQDTQEHNISEHPRFSELSGIQISFVGAISNDHIRGTVEGLNPKDYNDYKVVVFRLTDQWYIHPYQTGAEGRRFTIINDDGTWTIKAVWRGHQASKLALLLTKRTSNTPSVVPAGTIKPEDNLLAHIDTVAHSIINAPEGF